MSEQEVLDLIHKALLSVDVASTLDGDHKGGEIIATIKNKDYLILVRPLPEVPFNSYCDDWFDGLSQYSRFSDSLAPLKVQTAKTATKANLLTARQLFSLIDLPETTKRRILETFDAVTRKKFADEFRFTYSTSPRRVSAASALFSQLHQALTYYDDKRATP